MIRHYNVSQGKEVAAIVESDEITELFSGLTTGDFEFSREAPRWGQVGVISMVSEEEYEVAMSCLVRPFHFEAEWMDTCYFCTPPGDRPILVMNEFDGYLMRRLSDEEARQVQAAMNALGSDQSCTVKRDCDYPRR